MNHLDELEKLADLRDKGHLSEAEFQQSKRLVLGTADEPEPLQSQESALEPAPEPAPPPAASFGQLRFESGTVVLPDGSSVPADDVVSAEANRPRSRGGCFLLWGWFAIPVNLAGGKLPPAVAGLLGIVLVSLTLYWLIGRTCIELSFENRTGRGPLRVSLLGNSMKRAEAFVSAVQEYWTATR